MHRYDILITGLVMLPAGAYLAFTGTQALPLWFTWLAGTFLWNVGIALASAVPQSHCFSGVLPVSISLAKAY